MTLVFATKITVDSHAVKKNGRSIYRNKATGKSFLGKSSSLHKAEAHMVKSLKNSIKDDDTLFEDVYEGNNKITYPISGYLKVTFEFYFPKDKFYTKKGQINKKLPDLSNLYQLPEDCLTKAGIIVDDHYIATHFECKRDWTSGSKPYLVIKIYKDEARSL